MLIDLFLFLYVVLWETWHGQDSTTLSYWVLAFNDEMRVRVPGL